MHEGHDVDSDAEIDSDYLNLEKIDLPIVTKQELMNNVKLIFTKNGLSHVNKIELTQDGVEFEFGFGEPTMLTDMFDATTIVKKIFKC